MQFDSLTHYQFIHFTDLINDYAKIVEIAEDEWTENSYLEPDDINGYGYLEAVKSVFGDKQIK